MIRTSLPLMLMQNFIHKILQAGRSFLIGGLERTRTSDLTLIRRAL